MHRILMKQSFKNSYKGLIVWTAIFSFLALVTILMFPEIKKQSEQIQSLVKGMDFLKAFIGELDLTMFNGYVAGKWFATLPFLLSFYVILASHQIVSRELDTKTIEYTLSLPIHRVSLVLSRFFVVVFNSVLMILVLHLILLVSQAFIGERGSNDLFAYMSLNAWLLLVSFASLTLLISTFFNEYPKSLTTSIATILGLYMLQIIFKLTSVPEWLQKINLFYYFNPEQIVEDGTFPVQESLVLTIFSVLVLGLAVILFYRKEIK